LLVNGEIRQPGIDPAAGIVVLDSVFLDVERVVRVPAENAVGIVLARMLQGSSGYFRREPQPASIQTVDEADDRLVPEIEPLQPQIQRGAELAEAHIAHLKSIELMAVDCHVAQASELPTVLLVDPNTHQMRHDVGQAEVVVALDPDDFDVAPGIRKFADIAKKLPVFFGEAGKVEIGKDVAQKD